MRATAFTASFLPALIAPAAAFISFGCQTNIVEERADPIVSPLQVAGHVHKIVGGNAFKMSRNMTYQEIRSSTCSSCPIQQDLSIY